MKSSKKAFSMVEVIISISLFIIVFTSSFTVTTKYLKLKEYNFKLNKSIVFIEGLINTLKYNDCVDEVIYISKNSPVFIYEGDMSLEKLKIKGLYNLFNIKPPENQEMYVFLDAVSNGENTNIFTIKLEFKTREKHHKYVLLKELKDK